MTVDEISQYASKGFLPNDDVSAPDRCLFYNLLHIYNKYKSGELSKIQGEEQKQKALRRHEKDLLEYKGVRDVYVRQSKLWKEIERSGSEYRLNPSIENADKFLAAVYGCGRKEGMIQD